MKLSGSPLLIAAVLCKVISGSPLLIAAVLCKVIPGSPLLIAAVLCKVISGSLLRIVLLYSCVKLYRFSSTHSGSPLHCGGLRHARRRQTGQLWRTAAEHNDSGSYRAYITLPQFTFIRCTLESRRSTSCKYNNLEWHAGKCTAMYAMQSVKEQNDELIERQIRISCRFGFALAAGWQSIKS